MDVARRRRSPPLLPHNAVGGAWRGLRMLLQPERPLLAQLVVTRRCNLTCGYCNEYDNVSRPAPLPDLIERVDHLARLGALIVTLTGGEPLLHPKLDEVVRRVTSHAMVCTLNSNAYPITRRWVERLNAAKLFMLQVSIDNLRPNAVSDKSWSKVRQKLLILKEHARFGVTINAVLGSSPPDETRRLVEEVRALGFYMTVGLLHDDAGQIDSGLIGEDLPEFYAEMRRLCRKSAFHLAGEGWETRMLERGADPYRCRAGARYLYVDETGQVSYCSQRRGEPGLPLLEYGPEDAWAAFNTRKGCEAGCTIACVRRASSFDEWRAQPLAATA